LSSRSLLIDAGWRLMLAGGFLVAILAVATALKRVSLSSFSFSVAFYSMLAALVLVGLPLHAPHRRFGPANSLTLLRGAYMTALLGLMVDGHAPGETERWLLVASGTAALALDGVDGWAARRSGLASPFGARFDMEVDALFVLALCALAFRAGQAGGWVLLGGLLRYIFVLAGWMWPILTAPLPPSFRRKAICVVQVVVLLVALAPPVAPAAAGALALAGLLLLAYSFAADAALLTVRADGRATI
jgi:phosphatidylglycerophosphate synthase